MRRRQFLTGAAAGSLAGVAGCSLLGGAGGPAGPPRLSVDGRWLTGPDGERVVLRGVSVADPVWGTRNADARGKDYWDTLRLATDGEAGWHARVLRVPVAPDSIRDRGLDAIVADYLDRVVDLARKRGVYVLLDYHATERYDTSEIDERIRRFWDRVAPRYADEPHVLYELFSEPTEPASGGVEAWRTWREHAEPWVSLVRDHAPETPVVVGSPRWTSMTAFAAAEPFDDDNLLYAAHVYPSWEPETWEGTFGTPALDVPVFVTEWGYQGDESAAGESHLFASTDEWGAPFREWLDAHENVSWCAATFDSRRRPRVFDDDWSVLGGDEYMGDLLQDWLAERRDDHRPETGGGAGTAPAPGAGSPPSAPPGLRVQRIGESSATLAWGAASDHDDDRILQYRVAVDGDEPTVLRGSVRSIELSGLASAERYEARVTAVDARGAESAAATIEFQTVEPAAPDATIPRAPTEPEIDGDVDDVWSTADAHGIDTFLWGDPDSDAAGEWRAMWDESALYLLTAVTDGEIEAADSVELYLDPDHSRGSEYDGENDVQLVVVPGESEAWWGPNSAPAPDGTEVATAETEDGWRVEMALPWDRDDVTPVTGRRMGMDVHVADDLTGGDRDAKVAWFDASDRAWEVPSAFATVELGE